MSMTPTAPSLRVEVSPEMVRDCLAAEEASWTSESSTEDNAKAIITAAFQHPDFLAQIRRQVFKCLVRCNEYTYQANIADRDTRASIGRLLGEEA